MDCNYSTSSDPKPVNYEVILVTGISFSLMLLIMISLLFMLHCRHGKRVRHTESLQQLHPNGDGDLSDQSYIDPTEEVNPPAKQQSLAYVVSNKFKKQTSIATATDTDKSSMVPQF